jgi:hypothetical protein
VEEETVGHGPGATVGGEIQHLPVERERGGAAAVEADRVDRTEIAQRAGERPVRESEARAAAPVGDDEEQPAVRCLADGRPRVPARDLVEGEGLVGVPDGLAVADEAACRVRRSRSCW